MTRLHHPYGMLLTRTFRHGPPLVNRMLAAVMVMLAVPRLFGWRSVLESGVPSRRRVETARSSIAVSPPPSTITDEVTGHAEQHCQAQLRCQPSREGNAPSWQVRTAVFGRGRVGATVFA
ncbi:hypothetical protein [Amycolatopsis sp. cmx-11-51]|uniref:hypothetical protein n=1 Tax=unclassified Amycolatopsis TaxID=2618356 RepID=UPI0039E2A75E